MQCFRLNFDKDNQTLATKDSTSPIRTVLPAKMTDEEDPKMIVIVNEDGSNTINIITNDEEGGDNYVVEGVVLDYDNFVDESGAAIVTESVLTSEVQDEQIISTKEAPVKRNMEVCLKEEPAKRKMELSLEGKLVERNEIISQKQKSVERKVTFGSKQTTPVERTIISSSKRIPVTRNVFGTRNPRRKVQLCRLCLSKYCTLLPLFVTRLRFSSTPMKDVIQSCIGIQVSREDVSDRICRACITSLESMWTFREKCRQSDAVVQQMNMKVDGIKQRSGRGRQNLDKRTIDNACKSDVTSDQDNLSVVCPVCERKVLKKTLRIHCNRHKIRGEGMEEYISEMKGMTENEETTEVEVIPDIVEDGRTEDTDMAEPNSDQEHAEPEVPSERIPGQRPGTWIYADGKGFYFYGNVVSHSKRYLHCANAPICKVRAIMGLGENAPIRETLNKGQHCHPPDLDLAEKMRFLARIKKRSIEEAELNIPEIFEKEANGNQLVVDLNKVNAARAMRRARKAYRPASPENNTEGEEEERPSERLPSKNPGSWIYADGRGYYFHATTTSKYSKRYLKCIDINCKGKGIMGLEENAPIYKTSDHSHPPDFDFADKIQYLYCKKRSSEATDLKTSLILEEEVVRNELGDVVLDKKTKRAKQRARKTAQRSILINNFDNLMDHIF